MSRLALVHRPLFASLTLTCLAAAWWGCAAATGGQTTATSSTGDTTASSSSSSGTGGAGGMSINIDGGSGGGAGGTTCISTSASAHHIPLDIVFLIDQSGSMTGPKWIGTTAALTAFCNDPASAGIGAGLSYFPPVPGTGNCSPVHYETLDVPIDALPLNAFALTNSIAADALGGNTPTYPALQGTLMVATAYQDAHPTHKVVVVLATDGNPNGCDGSLDDIAALAKSALDYNGVLTYVIGVAGSTIASLDKIAVGGGTNAAYDITNDIGLLGAKMAEIRTVSLGCDFQIPPPPDNKQLNPDEVNVSYTPKGMGAPTVLLRANDLASCNGGPGWYYDNNAAPTKITLCPASCTVVQADLNAEINALFGCKSLLK